MPDLSRSAPRFLLRAPCSPIKSEFIRAKYQMLAFVHKLPCRELPLLMEFKFLYLLSDLF